MKFLHPVVILIVLFSLVPSEGLLRRCFQCRSRGELGSCKDPFKFNATEVDDEPGIKTIPCASGWCGKVIEGGGSFREDDYDMATERMCVQRGPSDSEDRCDYTVYKQKKVYMCFCQGDLCNGAHLTYSNSNFIMIISTLFVISLSSVAVR